MARQGKRRTPFDPLKDVLVKVYPTIQSGDTTIVAEAHKYNGGPVKLQITRAWTGGKPGKLGRITPGEAAALIPVLTEFARTGVPSHEISVKLDEERQMRKATAQEADRLDEERAAAAKAAKEDRANLVLDVARVVGVTPNLETMIQAGKDKAERVDEPVKSGPAQYVRKVKRKR